ncbi:Protein of unknown function [Pyronema omphalodes CBS 100304]|uniref:Uncharacterized protein n=1 Tax=Pyronema omphalodes (strain CBS 100304) TaxID=1076935 RepID=U4LHV6_PYROM|nr:Protein of unknown function [Pyronema omphalodes CBS 100304]
MEKDITMPQPACHQRQQTLWSKSQPRPATYRLCNPITVIRIFSSRLSGVPSLNTCSKVLLPQQSYRLVSYDNRGNVSMSGAAQ